MTHEKRMEHAVKLSAAFIQNRDLRHCGNFKDDGSANIQDQVALLVIQMYRAVEEASFEAQQTSWAKRAKGELPETA